MGSEQLTSEMMISKLQNKLVVSYLDVASGFLLLYDVLLSFGLEFEHIWKSKWSFFKILYLIQRYLPGVDTVIALPYHDFGTNFTLEVCQSGAQIGASIMLCGIILSEGIASAR
uniref:DUF6533 domain-containing protein n=1 Tax=Moniliophthora roreri TaxID=221103 RepID=A0A0W0G198_MONRR